MDGLMHPLRNLLFAMIAIGLVLLPISSPRAAPTRTDMTMEDMSPCPEKQSCCDKGMKDCADPFMCVSAGSACVETAAAKIDFFLTTADVSFTHNLRPLASLPLIPPRRPPRI